MFAKVAMVKPECEVCRLDMPMSLPNVSSEDEIERDWDCHGYDSIECDDNPFI